MTTRRDDMRNPVPLLAPTIESTPPGKLLSRMVRPLDLTAAPPTRPRSTSTSRSIGAMNSFEYFFAVSTVGCTTMMGHGSWCMWYAIAALMQSV